MDPISGLALGFSQVFQPYNLAFLFLGVVLGLVIGVLPGLGGTSGVAILLPLTLFIHPNAAIMMLAGLYWDAVYEDFVLLATWRALEGKASLCIPQDLEVLLEEVYEREDPESFSEGLRERARKSLEHLRARRELLKAMAQEFSLSSPDDLFDYSKVADLVAKERLKDDEENEKTQRLLTRLGDPSVAVVPLFRVGEGLFLDREGRRSAPLKGKISPEEAEALFRRAVRLSRYPIPETLLREDPPSAWKKSGLLRGLRPLEMGRVFGSGAGAFRVELDLELGVVYRPV